MSSEALLAYLLPIAFLLVVYKVALTGRITSFRPRAASLSVNRPTGPLMATWLALIAATWTLLELAGTSPAGGGPLTAGLVVTAILAAVIGLVLTPRLTLFLLAGAGIAAQAAGLATAYGPTAAAAILIITALTTGVYALARGLLQ